MIRASSIANPPLSPVLAAVLEKVNENKKLREQLKNSIDSPPIEAAFGNTTASVSNNNSRTTRSNTNININTNTNTNTTVNTNGKSSGKAVYSIDSDEESKPDTSSNVLFFVHSSATEKPVKFRCLKVRILNIL